MTENGFWFSICLKTNLKVGIFTIKRAKGQLLAFQTKNPLQKFVEDYKKVFELLKSL